MAGLPEPAPKRMKLLFVFLAAKALLSHLLADEIAMDLDKGYTPRGGMQRGALVMNRPDMARQNCPAYDSSSSSTSYHARPRGQRVPPPPARHQAQCQQCSPAQACDSSSSAACGSFWDYDCYKPQRIPYRPPPAIGSGENVQVLAYGAPTVSPILLGGVWAEDPVLNTGSFDATNLIFTGNNNQPMIINSVSYNLDLENTFYYSTTGQFTAVPATSVDSAYGIDQDPQYGSGQMTVFDPVTGFRFGFVVTNSKTYVLYQRQAVNPAAAFGYLIPVSVHMYGETQSLTISMNRSLRTASFFINGATVLTLTRPGAPIDPKFLVMGAPSIFSQADFPSSIVAELGIWAMPLTTPVCQASVFDLCNKYQTLQNANQMTCTKGALQIHPYSVASTLALSNLSLSKVNHIYPPCSPDCQQILTCCPQA